MTARALLVEAAARGIELYRVGDRVRWRAAAPPPAGLLGQLRAHKTALLPLVPPLPPDSATIYAGLADGYGTRDDLAAFAWAERHGHPDILATLGALERRCEDLARRNAPAAEYRHAVAQLVHLFGTVRAAYAARDADDAAPPAPSAAAWRVVVDERTPKAGPIRLNACTTITDPAHCIAATMIDLERAVAHQNAGRESAFTLLVDEYLATLAACGVTARVEVSQ